MTKAILFGVATIVIAWSCTLPTTNEKKTYKVVHNNCSDTTIVEADDLTLQSPMMGEQAYFFSGEKCITIIDSVNEIIPIKKWTKQIL